MSLVVGRGLVAAPPGAALVVQGRVGGTGAGFAAAAAGGGSAPPHAAAAAGTGSALDAVVPELVFLWRGADDVVAERRAAGRSESVPLTRPGPGVAVVDGAAVGLDADLVCLAAPWDAPLELGALLAAVRRRTLLVSATGEGPGGWYDGPLLHALSGGRLASYLPSGGAAALGVPLLPPSGLAGATLEAALATEGTSAERTHRCLLGRVAAALAAALAAAPAPHDGLVLSVASFDRRSAVALVLARQASRDADLLLVSEPPPAEVPPPWRRLCQNLAVRLAPVPYRGVAPLPLAALAALLDPRHVPELVQALNSISDVLPNSLT